MKKRFWLSPFFSENFSDESRGLIGLQRSALWIGLAMSLQALNEIGHDWFLSLFGEAGLFVPFLLYILSFLALYQALQRRAVIISGIRKMRIWQMLVFALIIIFALRGVYEIGRGIEQSVQEPPQYWNDGTSLDTNAAYLLLEGKNPYSDSRLKQLYERFAIQADWTTPLRTGRFAGRLDYPAKREIQEAFAQAVQSGQTQEFEEKVSYPALSFLPFVPFAWLKIENVFAFYLACYLLMLWIAWRVVRPEMRAWTIVLGLANIPMWSSAVGGNIDVLCFLFLLLSWLSWERRWISAICLGLACATKQTAWFFVPFYIVLIWRSGTWGEALKRVGIAGGVALLINAPFIVWDARAWMVGMLTPVADPMFADGVGIISFSQMHWLPYLPGWFYSLLEGGAMLGAIGIYWRICRKYPEAVMLLAVLPLFFAWRSLPSYFACAAFGIYVVNVSRHRQILPSNRHNCPQS